MKYLILLEGNTEKAFIEMLIDKGMFQIDTNNILDLNHTKSEKIRSPLDGTATLLFTQTS